MASLAPSVLIGYSSFFQVTSITIKSRLTSIGSCTVEFAAIERLKKQLH